MASWVMAMMVMAPCMALLTLICDAGRSAFVPLSQPDLFMDHASPSRIRSPLLSFIRIGITIVLVLKIKCFKFTHGLEPLYGDARSAKSLEVLTLIFSTDCSPIDSIDWSLLKITCFENVLLFYCFFENQVSRSRGGEIGLVWCLGRS
jgi:hypothetical protein